MGTEDQTAQPERLMSLDAYRGFVMMALVSGYFGIGEFLGAFGEYQTSHVAWTGCSLWDLIQPSFMFIVGVAMPFSYAARKARGDSDGKLFAHAAKRAIVLILLGVFLRSNHATATYWTFEDVVSQIGLSYVIVFLTLGKGIRAQAAVAATALIGYWLLFALWPLPAPDFDPYPNSDTAWQFFEGFRAHWNKGANPAGYFDQRFLNLFPRTTPWTFHRGGYATLSFIPSMANILIGVMAGELLISKRTVHEKFRLLVMAGLGCLAFGMVMDGTLWPGVDWEWGFAPAVKRVWTPTFAVFSAGWTLLFQAAFLWVIDLKGFRKWSIVFTIVGMNPLTIYILHSITEGWIQRTLDIHLGAYLFGGAGGEIIHQALTVLCLWGILFWMYRRKIFIRI